MRRLYKYVKPDFWIILLGIAFVGSVALVELYQIRLMGQIIDVGIANKDMNVILTVGLRMIGLALLGALIAVMGLVIPATATTRFAHRLRQDLFEKVQRFSVKNVSRFQTASLVTRLTNDVDLLQRTLLMSLRLLVRAPVLLVSTVSMTYATSKTLAQVPFVAIGGLSLVLLMLIVKGFPRFISLQKKLDNMNRRIQESLKNIRVIKSFVREDFEEKRFESDNQSYYDASMSAHSLMLIMEPAMMAAIYIATLFIIYLSTAMIIENKTITIGDLLVFINYLRFTMFSMMMITNVFMMITRSKASLQRINEIFAIELDIKDMETVAQIDLSECNIEFDNVSFSYYDEEESKPALDKISLQINQGDRIGIIGGTGSGKTTFVNLLSRLADVSSGRLSINGIDVKNLPLQQLRSTIGFVPQKSVLFSGTVGENLRLGNQVASDEVLVKATTASSVYEFVESKPERFDYQLQQGGSNLSGGQRQRFCIARALVLNPNVLVLDDSTSALDAATEARVMNAISHDFQGMTIISIAQKISSVSQMDRILVLDEGQVAGFDTHTELMKHCDVYQEIYHSQIREQEIQQGEQ